MITLTPQAPEVVDINFKSFFEYLKLQSKGDWKETCTQSVWLLNIKLDLLPFATSNVYVDPICWSTNAVMSLCRSPPEDITFPPCLCSNEQHGLLVFLGWYGRYNISSIYHKRYIKDIYIMVGWLFEFYGISTFVVYLTPNPFLCK